MNVMMKSTDFRVFGILSPLRADIIAVSGREPVIQYPVIKRVELGLDSLLVVVELYGLRRYILRIATTGETKNCVGNQSGKAITESLLLTELNNEFFLDGVVREHKCIVKLTIIEMRPENIVY